MSSSPGSEDRSREPPLAPGVFIDQLATTPPAITGVPTGIAAFVGRTRRGPVGEPVRLNGFSDFERAFGGLRPEDPLGHAVDLFFRNGGAEAVIVRAFNPAREEETAAAGDAAGDAAPGDLAGFVTAFALPGPAGALTLVASEPGAWADGIEVVVEPADAGSSETRFGLTVRWMEGGLRAAERFPDLSTEPGSPREVTAVLERESELVRVVGVVPERAPAPSPTGPDGEPVPAAIARPGSDGGLIGHEQVAGPGLENAGAGIYALDGVRFDLLCIPPFAPDRDVDRASWDRALAYCRARRAMLLVDPPAAWQTPDDILDPVSGIDGTRSPVPRDPNAALYYPRIRLRDAAGGPDRTVAPSGAVAGVYARTDSTRGVWKAPAGLDAALRGAAEPDLHLDDGDSNRLNPHSVNALRSFPGAGTVVWGARTLAGTDAASEWKYVPVRRLALYLEESIERGTRWALFEPNEQALWSRLRLVAGTFLHGLWRQGAFAGTKPTDGFFVRCDGGTTSPEDIQQGIVDVMIGFAPLKPAEFVVLRLRLRAGETSEETGHGHERTEPPPDDRRVRAVTLPRTRIEPRARWDDLVLPEPALRALRTLTDDPRRGPTALFSGPSGTGKTLAAEVLASELGRTLYRVDLGTVVSKYIGETEKNLARLLEEADAGGWVLFFDEADALFGRRTGVRDAHDRYANQETSHLLQRIEAYGGLAILVTNREDRIDPRILRRLRVVRFPRPRPVERAAIWRRLLPTDPAHERLDVDMLARLDVTGGDIHALTRTAEFLAGERERPLQTRDILQAAGARPGKLDRR